MADHRRILTVDGERTPRYEVKRQAVLGAWGSKCHVTSPAHEDQEVAVIDFHVIPRTYVEIQLPRRHHRIELSLSNRKFDASGGLGSLHCKGTGAKAYGQASWEWRDASSLVMAVEIDDQQVNGVVSLWRENLDAETIEELVVVGIAQIEEYKRTMRNAKTSFVGAIINK